MYLCYQSAALDTLLQFGITIKTESYFFINMRCATGDLTLMLLDSSSELYLLMNTDVLMLYSMES